MRGAYADARGLNHDPWARHICAGTCPAQSKRSQAAQPRGGTSSGCSLGWDDQLVQLPRVGGKDPISLVGDEDRVRVAEPAQLLDVHARLDGENHPGLEYGVVAAVEERRLVALAPDRVADVVAQRLLDAELLGELNAGELDLRRRHAWRHDLDRAALQRE